MTPRFVSLVLLFVMVVCGENSAQAVSYTITSLKEGSEYRNTHLYNAGGYRLSIIWNSSGVDCLVLDHNGIYTRLDQFDCHSNSLPMINNKGQVVGTSKSIDGEEPKALFWNDGTYTNLGTLGGQRSSAWHINNRGLIAGISSIAGDEATHGFVYENGKMIDIGTLGGKFSTVSGLNENGQVIGSSSTLNDENQRAFLWQNGNMIDLGNLINVPNADSFATHINSKGQVVGTFSYFFDAGWRGILKRSHAFLYSDGVLTDINSLCSIGMTIESVIDFDDSGKITAHCSQEIDWGLYRDYTIELTPVPEPSTVALLLTGLTGVVFLRWRRR